MAERKEAGKRPIVIVRRKAAHGGGHGGSWKVAYADFVTAMMAFFLVMWIMGMDSRTRDLIQGYFNNPVGFKRAYSAGTNPLSMGNSPRNSDIHRLAMSTREFQRSRFEKIRDEIRQQMVADDSLKQLAGQVEMIITNEGLRIELLDDDSGRNFFDRGSATPDPLTRRLLLLIGHELNKIPNPLVIEGHTDAASYGGTVYSNWELSTDRANAARRILMQARLDPGRIAEVRGYADRDLRLPSSPLAAANRRVSILLPFQQVPAVEQFVPGSVLPLHPAARPLPPDDTHPATVSLRGP